jgi:uncharacterized cupin superfamily protein
MSEPNVYETEWDLDATDSPMRGRAARVGAHAGARELGASVYELQPGGAISPYHLHHGNEELLVVLAGRPALRTEAGTRTLAPGAVVAFPAGPDGAHRVFNPSGHEARVLLVSTMRFPEVAEHADTGTVLTMTGPATGQAFPAGTDRPFPELYVAAMRAAAEREADPGDG